MNPKKDIMCKISRGFTLMEVMVVIVLLGVLASIVVASFQNSERETANTVFAHDIRVAANGFQVFNLQNDGVFPPEQSPGVMPSGMADYLGRMKWSQEETPIGGMWDWDYGVFGVIAAMSVNAPDRDSSEMIEIDNIIDDGNLLTGSFRARADGYMLVLKE